MKGKMLLLASGAAALAISAKHKRSQGESAPAMVASFRQPALAIGEAVDSDEAREQQHVADDRLDLAAMRQVGDHYEINRSDGSTAILTLDPELQELAEQLVAQAKAPRAAIVVTNQAGQVLAIAGQKLGEDPEAPEQFDPSNATVDPKLAIDSWAPAASVFKVVTAAALVRAGVSPTAKTCYHGGVRSVAADNLVDSAKDGNCETLGFAVAHSQNAIIGKLAFKHLDPTGLGELANALGFSSGGGDLAGKWGQVSLAEDANLEFAQNAAGFSGSRLSAVGGAVLANTVARRGNKVAPTIVRSIRTRDGVETPLARVQGEQVLERDDADKVAEMMAGTCAHGSASRSFARNANFPRGLSVAGKTGTLSASDPIPLHYSWFVGFAPVQNPEVSVSVVFGNTENWTLKAHMAAATLVERALAHDSGKRNQPRRRDQW